ncbi:MAG: membrane protein insertase YidC [Oscillospiraceae bacterium]|jgi:YidC/Oxa1 family membrane protein insertase|nr:membrane protein insertase YidC [Oscillospiraceae bacterium]
MDFILLPFKLLLQGLNALFHNYGVALLFFALVMNAIFTPFYAKSKKGQLRMQRFQPKVKELEKKFGTDKAKYQQELAKLYKEEKVSMTGGCVWMLVPMLVMLAVYSLIRLPFTKLIGLTTDQFNYIRDNVFPALGLLPANSSAAYEEIQYAEVMHSHFDAVMAQIRGSGDALAQGAAETLNKLTAQDLNFSLFGLNLGGTPNWRIWESGWTWGAIGLFLLPLISVALSFLSMKISQKLQGTDPAAQQQMKGMMYIGPLFSLYIGFVMPGLMSLYWVANSFIGIVRDIVLTKVYKKKVDEEFAIKDAERALRDAELEQKRLETEKLKAEGETIENPNTSKKKRELQEKREREEKSREWEEAHAVKRDDGDSKEAAAKVGDRQFARGRNYKPDRFTRKGQNTPNNEEVLGDEIT